MNFLTGQLSDLAKRHELLRYLTVSELKIKYRNLAFGFAWAVLDPFFMMAIYFLLVKVIFERGGPQYPAELLTGLIAYRWFSHAGITAVKSMISNSKLLQTVKFPPSILPLSRVVIALINFAVGLVLLFPLLYFFDAKFTLHLLWLPLLVAIQFLFTYGICLLLAISGIYFRDLQNLMQFALRLLLYASPVLYSINQIPAQYQLIYKLLNPLAGLFESYKNILIYGTAPDSSLAWTLLSGLLITIFSFWLAGNRGSNLTKDL